MAVRTKPFPSLAQLLGVAVVRVDVDRALERERLVEPVQLVLNRLRSSLGGGDLLAHDSLPRLPYLQHGFLEQSHVAWRWLEEREFLGEEPFELGFRDVHGPATRAATESAYDVHSRT